MPLKSADFKLLNNAVIFSCFIVANKKSFETNKLTYPKYRKVNWDRDILIAEIVICVNLQKNAWLRVDWVLDVLICTLLT